MSRNMDKTNIRLWRGMSQRNPNDFAEDQRDSENAANTFDYIPRSDPHLDEQERTDLEIFHEYLEPWEARNGREAWLGDNNG